MVQRVGIQAIRIDFNIRLSPQYPISMRAVPRVRYKPEYLDACDAADRVAALIETKIKQEQIGSW